MGKKSLLYLTIYGSVVKFLCPHHFFCFYETLVWSVHSSYQFFVLVSLSPSYSQVGVGSYVVHYFSTLVTSILENFGFSEEMHNPVSNLSSVYEVNCSLYLSNAFFGKIVAIR
jgi:hypothetical protein